MPTSVSQSGGGPNNRLYATVSNLPSSASTATLVIRGHNAARTQMLFSTRASDGATNTVTFESLNVSNGQLVLNTPSNNYYSNLPAGTIVTAQVDGQCESDYAMISGKDNQIAAPVITSTSLTNSSTSISGTVSTSGATILLYRNGTLTSTVTASGTSWTAGSLTMSTGDEFFARAQSGTTNAISVKSNKVVVGSAQIVQSDAPEIQGSYTSSSTSVSGISNEVAGTTITLYRNETTVLGTTTVNAFGGWEITGLSLSAGDKLKAKARAPEKSESDFSNETTVVATIPGAPTVSSPIVAGATTISGTGGSGTIHVYADGALIGTTTGGSWTLTLSSTVDSDLGASPRDLIRVGTQIHAINVNTTDNVQSVESNSVTVTQGPASKINVYAVPANPIAGSSSTIFATLYDDFDSPIASGSVAFSRTSGSGTLVAPTTVSTNSLGLSSVQYETISTIETSEITGQHSSLNQTTEVTTIAGPATEISPFTIASNSIEINGSTTVTATVKDTNGNVVPNVSVSFSSDQTSRATVQASVTTNSSGVATATVTGANEGVAISGITDNGDGTYSVTYTPVNAGEDQITIQFGGDPVDNSPFTSLVLPADDERSLSFLQSPNAFTEAGNQIGTIIVEAVDSDGNRITGFNGVVTISITEGTGGPIATDATLIGTTSVTAVNGVATFPLITMERAGVNYTLTATTDDYVDGISAPFTVEPGPPWELQIRERDEESDIIRDFFGNPTQQSMLAKGKGGLTMNNQALLEGNRIPMFLVILDEFGNITFVDEGDTEVAISTTSPSGRFYLQQTASDPTFTIIIPRGQRFTNFFYEDPSPGQLTINGTAFPPPGARQINPGQRPLTIRMPGRIQASPDETKAEMSVRKPILVSLRDLNGERVWAPVPGVTINLSSSSSTGRFYSSESGGEPIVSTVIEPATTSVIVYYMDSTIGTHTLYFEGEGVPNPNDDALFIVEGGGELSQLVIFGPDTLRAGEKGGTFQLVLQDEFQNEITTQTDLTFKLEMKDGQNTTLYRRSESELVPLDIFELTIPAGKSSIPFYLSQTHAAQKVLQASTVGEEIDMSANKPVYFRADDENIALAMIAGDGQVDLVMQPLSENLIVTIIDQYQNPIPGRDVIFSLIDTPFGASAMQLTLDKRNANNSASKTNKFTQISDVKLETDSLGTAEITFILGNESGDYIIEATSPGLEPVQFVVTAISLDYQLDQNYPNPFKNGTTIYYEVPETSDVVIEVYDMIGRRVTTLVHESKEMGRYMIEFDANRHNLASGVYIYRMVAKSTVSNDGFTMVRRMVYIK